MTVSDRIDRAIGRIDPDDVLMCLQSVAMAAMLVLWLACLATLGWPLVAWECWWRGFR